MVTNGPVTDTFGYYRRNANDYYIYEDISYFGFDNPVWGEYIFLKDAPAGTTWTSNSFSGTVQGNPVTVRIRFTINTPRDVSTSITSSTGTRNYYNTIVVKEELEGYDGTNWSSLTSSVGYILDYYARNVGMILKEFYNGSGTMSGMLTLRRSVVY
jgi:hypothetical protein